MFGVRVCVCACVCICMCVFVLVHVTNSFKYSQVIVGVHYSSIGDVRCV